MQRAKNGSLPWLEWVALIVVVAAGVSLVLVWAQIGRLGRGSLDPAQTEREYAALTYTAPLGRLDLAASQFRRSVETDAARAPNSALVAHIDSLVGTLRAHARQTKILVLDAPIAAIESAWASARTDRYPGNARREEALSSALLDAQAALESVSGLAYDREPKVQKLGDALLVDIPLICASVNRSQILAENAARRQSIGPADLLELAVMLDRARGERRDLRSYSADGAAFNRVLTQRVLRPQKPEISTAEVRKAAEHARSSILRLRADVAETLRRTIASRIAIDHVRARYALWLTTLAILLIAGLAVACEELIRSEMRARSDRNALRAAQDQLARQKAERALHLSEAQYRAVFNGAALGISVLASDGTIIEANGVFRNAYAEDAAALLAGHERAFAELMMGTRDVFSFEQHAITVSGGEIWTDCTVSRVNDVSGGPPFAVCMFRDLTELKRNERRMLHGMTHDALTGLLNRAQFESHVRDSFAEAHGSEGHFFAVLFVDLDRFRDVNESLGHDVGDFVLSQVGARIRGIVASEDAVARLSSDEFAVLLSSLTDILQVEAIARRISSLVSKPVELRDRSIIISSSIGIAVGSAAYERCEDVLRDADIALRNAKTLGGSRYALFDATMDAQAGRRLQVATDLRLGLQRGEFMLVYQPIVSIGNGEFAGCEALVRWQHPTQGVLLPTDFMPLAEQLGMAGIVGRFVLDSALQQLAFWKRTVPSQAASLLSININVSPIQILDDNFEKNLIATALRWGIEPREVILEITESFVLDPGSRSSAMVERLRAAGFKVAIDDFGTGYSSLRYLQQFTVDSIKIDRSFVAAADGNVGSEPILRTLMALAEAFDVRVVAEGIESRRQRDLLENLGCTYAQGYYYSRPLPADELAIMYPRVFGGSATTESGNGHGPSNMRL
ncbi:MAG: bifunctional diguanylate cyclase/phosphodiesterase [Candidatus Eremiobacteraeota bacterium]|nr:bifunctional diguanylate cyclase/phosphodiesterase [Candidatus Eremiobacteraeota bacterium]